MSVTTASKLVQVFVRHHERGRDETRPVWVKRTDAIVWCPCCQTYLPIPWDEEVA
jgi:hypothetical protein